jgi:diadenosine tetraphosphate (Ap4A) HIT family hydrolase
VTTLQELIDDPWFPFEGDVRVKSLLPRVVPEPDRHATTRETCGACAKPDDAYVWTDERWRLRSMSEPSPVPGIVLLETREHLDSYADMSDDLLAAVGPLTARIERALLSLGDVARVHVARYGDGSAHFHQWFFPRPLGELQLRGSMLPVWLDVLPPVDPEVEADMLARLGAAMRGGG